MALFFSQRKPRGFNYTPRYYDPEREEREERKKIVLRTKYRSPKELAREAAMAASAEEGAGANGANRASGARVVEASGAGGAGSVGAEYVPGAFLREHVAARRGSTHAADVMRRRRRKSRSIPMLIAILAGVALLIWILYFK